MASETDPAMKSTPHTPIRYDTMAMDMAASVSPIDTRYSEYRGMGTAEDVKRTRKANDAAKRPRMAFGLVAISCDTAFSDGTAASPFVIHASDQVHRLIR